jgi:hypothetical protein
MVALSAHLYIMIIHSPRMPNRRKGWRRHRGAEICIRGGCNGLVQRSGLSSTTETSTRFNWKWYRPIGKRLCTTRIKSLSVNQNTFLVSKSDYHSVFFTSELNSESYQQRQYYRAHDKWRLWGRDRVGECG